MNIDIAQFGNLIKEKTGLVFKNGQSDKLLEVVCEAMGDRGIESSSNYFELISKDSKEFYDLVSCLTTNETYFFRDPDQFKMLCERLIPNLLAGKKPGEKVGILSAGCSTGAEPYSVVIALMEQYGDSVKNLFTVIGLDIDKEAIKAAKEGIYFGRQAFRTLDTRIKDKYFDKLSELEYRIRPDVKEIVDFYPFNLLTDPFPDRFQEMSIVFYRNVSIYFEPEKQKKIFENLSKIIQKKGYLITSPSETLPHDLNIMSLLELDGIFLYRKDPDLDNKKQILPSAPEFGSSLSDSSSLQDRKHFREKPVKPKPIKSKQGKSKQGKSKQDKSKPLVPTEDSLEICLDEAVSLAKSKKYKKALAMIDILLETAPSNARLYVLKSSILINLKQTDEAKEVCFKLLETDALCLEGYLISGLIAYGENNQEEARKMFKKALYIETTCWLAHYFLAEGYRSDEDKGKAYQEYELTANILEKGNFTDYGDALIDFSFSSDQILHLCKHNMKKIK